MKAFFVPAPKRLIVAIVLVCAQFGLQAQALKQFSSHAFSVNEGLLANRIVDIAEDNAGFVWVSFGAGLQRFNGNEFEAVLPHAGLPETNHPHFFKLADGSLWLSYHSGISAYNSVTNKFEVIYETPESDLINMHEPDPYQASPVMPVLETVNAVWCWSAVQDKFISIDKLTHQVAATFNITGKLPGIKYFRRSRSGNLLMSFNEGIAEIDLTAKKIVHLYRVPGIQKLVYDYLSLKNDKLLLATNKGVFVAGLTNGSPKLLSNYPPTIDTGSTASISMNYLYNDLFVIAVNNQLYIFNANSGKFLYQMVNRQKQNFFDLGYITYCMPDRFHNLWLLSFSGLRKINFGTFSIKYYGVPDVRKNFSRFIYPDKKANLVITGSLFNQLSVFDTSGHLLKQFSISPNTAAQQVSCILKAGKNKYLVFADGKHSVYLLNTATMALLPLRSGLATTYFPLKIMGDTAAILAEPTGVVKAVYSGEKIRLTPLVNTTVLCALMDDKGQLWIGGAGKYTLLNGKSFANQYVFYLEENVVTKCFFQDSEKNIWLGTEEGLYKVNPSNGAVLRVYKKETGLADENIYSVQEDADKNIWCSTNKGISCIYKNGRIMNLYASDGLQGNEFNTNVSATASDGELFFGGTNGVNSFFPDQIKIPGKKPLVLLQRIKVMDAEWQSDTAAWCLHRIELPYTKNIITFNFTAFGHYEPNLYHYRYKMQGIDKNWVNAGNIGQARYLLPPGKYNFEYAAGVAGESSSTIENISVIITPLFWQTLWFKVVIILIAATMLWAMTYLYNKRKYQKKLQQIKMQQSIQRERHRISRDLHDNVGAYTTALTAGAEELLNLTTKEDVIQTAENLSANAKNIIASLQETIWVLNNDIITITDFSDRLKVYTKKILHHNKGIQIRFQEMIVNDVQLSPGEALNVFRVMQEALHNVLRHSRASQINIEIISNNESTGLSIKDNGNGFDLSRPGNGNGMYNMRHRCEEAGYELYVHSNRDGTVVSLKKNHSFAV